MILYQPKLQRLIKRGKPVNWFVENIHIICGILIAVKKQLFQLISTFQAPNPFLALLLS